MLNAFTSIIFNFTVDKDNTTSLKKIYGYLFIDKNQNFVKDYSNTSGGKFEGDKKNTSFVLF